MARLGRHKDKMREGNGKRKELTAVGAVVVGGEWRRGKVSRDCSNSNTRTTVQRSTFNSVYDDTIR